jgi:hypothetical protein
MNPGSSCSGPSRLAARARILLLALVVLACAGDRTGTESAGPSADSLSAEARTADRRPDRSGVTPESLPADPARVAATPGDAGVILARLDEYRIRLSINDLPAGKVTISFRNEGRRVHTIEIRGDNAMRWRTLPIRPGATATLTMDLPQGRYAVMSAEPPYVDRGMTALLLVR